MKLADFLKEQKEEQRNKLLDESKLEIILEILKKINGSLNLDEVLFLVLQNAISITQSDRGFIVLKNRDDELEFALCLDSNGNIIPKELFDISTTIVNEVFDSGESKFIESAQDDAANRSQSIMDLKLQTLMCAPLKARDIKIGVIYVDSRNINKVNTKDIIELFEILAHQASIAINNALMYQSEIKYNHELKEVVKKLEVAQDEANRFELMKDHFLMQMSHEIRTPFNILFGSLEILKSHSSVLADEEMIEMFGMIGESGHRIIRTVDEIIELGKLKTGEYKLQPTSVKIYEEILLEIVEDYKSKAEAKKIELSIKNDNTNNEIVIDKFTTYQIFKEIVDNAVKYTKMGSVKIKLYSNKEDLLTVNIEDTGIGISKEFLANLFEPFQQEDSGPTRKYEGNGLALSIVRRYANLNNISIDVESEKNKGTSFTLTFNGFEE